MIKRILFFLLIATPAWGQSQSVRWTHHSPRQANVHARYMTYEIGDSTKPSPDPSFNIHMWGGQANFRLHLPSELDSMESFNTTASTRATKPDITFSTAKVRHETYFRPGGMGALEWEIFLPTKPDTNVWHFAFESEGLRFAYQRPFPIVVDSGTIDSVFGAGGVFDHLNFMPDSVGGGYVAVLSDPTKRWRRTVIDSTNGDTLAVQDYGVGIAFHAFVPLAIDILNDSAYCDYEINTVTNLVRIELPTAAWNNLRYPVTIGPTFGNETLGVIHDSWTSASTGLNSESNDTYTASAGDIVTEMFFGGQGSGTDDSVNCGLYDIVTTDITNQQTTDVAPVASATNAFYGTGTISFSLSAGTEYTLAGDHANGAGVIDYAYFVDETDAGNVDFSGFRDPWVTGERNTKNYSFKADYTVAAAAEETVAVHNPTGAKVVHGPGAAGRQGGP